jgi:hypothetical protein
MGGISSGTSSEKKDTYILLIHSDLPPNDLISRFKSVLGNSGERCSKCVLYSV